jgi:hypothetical protein
MSQDMIANQEIESLEGLVSPPQLPVDLLDADIALEMPMIALLTSISSSDARLATYLSNPANQAIIPMINAFRDWIAAQEATGTRDEWARYLVSQREMLLDSTWAAYDGEANEVELAVRELIGDELLGASLLMRFLREAEVLDDEDERRFVSLWNWLLVNELLSNNEEEALDEKPTEAARTVDEW